MIRQNFPKIIMFLGLVCLLNIGLSSQALSSDSILTIKIILDKKVFSLGEPISGKVIISNSIPTSYPTNFRTQLFRDGVAAGESITNVPLFFGPNEFRLKVFLSPEMNTGSVPAGRWRIVITHMASDKESAQARFTIK